MGFEAVIWKKFLTFLALDSCVEIASGGSRKGGLKGFCVYLVQEHRKLIDLLESDLMIQVEKHKIF